MADSRPIHGFNGRIQVDATVIAGANAWSINVTFSSVEVTEFEDTWVRNLGGQKSASGSITAWQYQDKRVLMDELGTEGRLWIYPDKDDLTNYWYGLPLFTNYTSDGSTTSAVSGNLDWLVGSDGVGMIAYGFA